jgi:hypothetical protein
MQATEPSGPCRKLPSLPRPQYLLFNADRLLILASCIAESEPRPRLQWHAVRVPPAEEQAATEARILTQ